MVATVPAAGSINHVSHTLLLSLSPSAMWYAPQRQARTIRSTRMCTVQQALGACGHLVEQDDLQRERARVGLGAERSGCLYVHQLCLVGLLELLQELTTTQHQGPSTRPPPSAKKHERRSSNSSMQFGLCLRNAEKESRYERVFSFTVGIVGFVKAKVGSKLHFLFVTTVKNIQQFRIGLSGTLGRFFSFVAKFEPLILKGLFLNRG